VTDETKVMVDTLYKEFQRVSSKSVATDDWFFRFLSIAVVPFLVFLAYCLVTPGYRIFVATLPFLSLLGLAVVAVLTTHYQYAGAYGEHLINRINQELGAREIRHVEFDRACYKGWHSPVTISYILGFGVLIFLNVLAVPVINSAREAFLALSSARDQQLSWLHIIINHYWLVTINCVVIIVIAFLVSFIKVHVLTRRLLKGVETSVEPSSNTPTPSSKPGRSGPTKKSDPRTASRSRP